MKLKPVMTVEDLTAFIETEFPQVVPERSGMETISVEQGKVLVRFTPRDEHLRPGGTVSGPSLFTLADCAAYMVILAHIGPVGLAVTTNLNINFMHKSAPGQIDCEASLLKLGKRLAVTDMAMRDQNGTLVAHATSTYSIPPRS